jgi:hypothetical protein
VSATGAPVILGAFANLPIHHLEPFARSLRATGSQARICIVAAGYGSLELEQLAGIVDVLHNVDAEYGNGSRVTNALLSRIRRTRGMRRTYPPIFAAVARTTRERNSLERWRKLEFHLEGLQSLRYGHYYRCLLEDVPDADVVMISDLRDVIFQRDPFADPVNGLEVYLEDDSLRIGNDHFNTRWLRELYGSKAVEAMRGRVISCSGTVFGTRYAMLEYLSEMMMSIAWRRRPMGPHDQGVHNALVASGRLGPIELVRNEHGRVLTLGAMKHLRANDEGFLINADGSVPPVVHQWDRHGPSVSKLRPFPFLRAQ